MKLGTTNCEEHFKQHKCKKNLRWECERTSNEAMVARAGERERVAGIGILSTYTRRPLEGFKQGLVAGLCLEG